MEFYESQELQTNEQKHTQIMDTFTSYFKIYYEKAHIWRYMSPFQSEKAINNI